MIILDDIGLSHNPRHAIPPPHEHLCVHAFVGRKDCMTSDKNLCVGDYLVGSAGEPNMQLHKRSLGSVHLCPVSHMFHPLPHHVIEVCLPSQSASANYQEKKPTNLCAPHECLTRHTVCTLYGILYLYNF